MSDIVYLEKVNETVVKVDCNDEVAHNLYCRYSAYSPGYIFNPRYKMHVWDGMIHMYTPRSSTSSSCVWFCVRTQNTKTKAGL